MKSYCLDVPNSKLWDLKVVLLLLSANKSLMCFI